LKHKKLQKDEILGAFAPKITSFYTTTTAKKVIKVKAVIKYGAYYKTFEMLSYLISVDH
jgi:hypothetical protein